MVKNTIDNTELCNAVIICNSNMKNVVQIKISRKSQHISQEPTNTHPHHHLQLNHQKYQTNHHGHHNNLTNLPLYIPENKPQSANTQTKRVTSKLKIPPSSRQPATTPNQSNNAEKNDDLDKQKGREDEVDYSVGLEHNQLRQKLRLTTLCFEMKGKVVDRSKQGLAYKYADLASINRCHKLQSVKSQLRLKSVSRKHHRIQIETIQQVIQQGDATSKHKDSNIRISKRRSQHLVPKSKISIKNIESRLEEKPSKKVDKNDKVESNYTFFRKDNSTNVNLQQIKEARNNQIRQSVKSKRNKKDNKIPDFIKLTLQNYYQFNDHPKIQCNVPIPHTNQAIGANHQAATDLCQPIASTSQQPEQKTNNQIIGPITLLPSAEQQQEQSQYEFLSNKMDRLSQQTNYANKSGQMKRRRLDVRQFSIDKDRKAKRAGRRQCQSKQTQQLCAWQQMDPQIQHDLYLKL